MILTPLQRTIDWFMLNYLQAMEFTDFESTGLPPLSQEMTVQVLRDCGDFVSKIWDEGWDSDSKMAQAGHDFWLTRNGHGAGFWDGDWKEPFASLYDKLSEDAGKVTVCKGDDGLLYQTEG